MNHVTLIGRVGKDPEIRTFDSGNKLAEFSVATTERYKDGDEWKEATEWHNIKTFRQAEFCEKYLNKGDLVAITGSIKTRSYEKNGERKYITEIMASNVDKLVWEKKTMSVENVKAQAETNDLPF